jgi:hypothetical protein
MVTIYNLGKFSASGIFRVVEKPSRGILGLTSVIFIGVLLSLAVFVKGSYLTPEEFQQSWVDRMSELRSRLQNTNADFFEPPPAGFYIYLDRARIGVAYSNLQSDLRLAQETKTMSAVAGNQFSINSPGLAAQRSKSRDDSDTKTFSATEISPERQAAFVIKNGVPSGNKLIGTAGVVITPALASANLLRILLKDYGIALNADQESQLADAVVKRDSESLSKQRSSLVLLVRAGVPGTRMVCSNSIFSFYSVSSDSLPTKWQATLDPQYLQTEVKNFLEKSGKGWSPDQLTFLGIAWNYEVSTNEVDVQVIPLCIW